MTTDKRLNKYFYGKRGADYRVTAYGWTRRSGATWQRIKPTVTYKESNAEIPMRLCVNRNMVLLCRMWTKPAQHIAMGYEVIAEGTMRELFETFRAHGNMVVLL